MFSNYRIILFPFALLYALITEVRNLLYDKNILKSTGFDIPVINVGNLSVGGTGKTPMIEYLIRLLQADYKIAVVSRGYKRKTKGFLVANHISTPEEIGDEPYQIHRKFDKIIVAVGEKRKEAIRKVLVKFNPDIILLDDAFQHRSVHAGLHLLLTPYYKIFPRDYVLPAGDLRECRHQAKRADIVIVSKSPTSIKETEIKQITNQIHRYNQQRVFFSNIAYSEIIYSQKEQIPVNNLHEYSILLVTGIANPLPLYEYLSKKNLNFDSLKFGDHHHFSKADIQRINKSFQQIQAEKKIILTTEKDFVRLNKYFEQDLYYLPIQTKMIDNEAFNNKILNYVKK